EHVVEEVLHLAAALAHQATHDDVGVGAPRDLAEEGRLAHARAREDADPLSAADRVETIDGAHARLQHLADRDARERIGCCAAHGARSAAHGRAAVDPSPEAVDDPSEERTRDAYLERSPERDDFLAR